MIKDLLMSWVTHILPNIIMWELAKWLVEKAKTNQKAKLIRNIWIIIGVIFICASIGINLGKYLIER